MSDAALAPSRPVAARGAASSLTAKQWTIGLKKNWLKIGVPALLQWCGGWMLALNVASLAVADLKPDPGSSPVAFALIVLSALGFAAYKSRLPLKVSFLMRGTGTTVDVEFADLFAERDHIAVPVNEHFDCEVGVPVAERSVHGQLIQRIYGGNQARFQKEVDEALAVFTATSSDRAHPRANAYPIGTTAVVHMGSRIGFLFALAKTHPKTSKASSTVPLMFEALAGLWRAVRDDSGGRTVSLPLAGGGQSGLGFIGSNELLRNILLSAFIASQEAKITDRIRVVLHDDQIGRIDLRQIEKEWK